jgi:hypothetical protein
MKTIFALLMLAGLATAQSKLQVYIQIKNPRKSGCDDQFLKVAKELRKKL